LASFKGIRTYAGWQVVGCDDMAVIGEHDNSFHKVFELADTAGPAVFVKKGQRVIGYTGYALVAGPECFSR
jgi:hypothetical protein